MGMSRGGMGVQQLTQQMPGYGPGEASNMNYGQGGQYNTLAQDMSRNVQGQMQAQQQGPTSLGGYGQPGGVPGTIGGYGGYQGQGQSPFGGGGQQPGMMYAGGSPGWAGGQGRGGGMGGMMGGRYGQPPQSQYSPYGNPYQQQGNQYGFGSSYSPFQGQGGQYGQQGGQPQQMQGGYGGGMCY